MGRESLIEIEKKTSGNSALATTITLFPSVGLASKTNKKRDLKNIYFQMLLLTIRNASGII